MNYIWLLIIIMLLVLWRATITRAFMSAIARATVVATSAVVTATVAATVATTSAIISASAIVATFAALTWSRLYITIGLRHQHFAAEA